MVLITSPCCGIFSATPPPKLDIDARIYPADEYTAVKRVLFLPFSNETSYKNQGEIVEEAFAREFTERGCFEVVNLPPEDEKLAQALNPQSRGTFSLTVLIELGEYYKVDAVLLGCLRMYEPYPPPMISLKADLIAVHNGEILRTVSGLLDAGKENVARDISLYYSTHCSQDDSLFEWHKVTSSPSMYADYACHRIIKAMYPETGRL